LGCAILVWWLVLLTFSTPAMKEEKIARHANIIALFAGLIFVSHPVQIEAVTYIWQRAASMAAFFYLASLCFYIKARLIDLDNPQPKALDNSQEYEITFGPGSFYYICSLIIAVIAMFTKENAITLPLMVLLYEFCFFKIKKENLKWVQLFPFLLIMFIIPRTMSLTMSARFQELQSITQGPNGISPFHYLLTQFRVMITYIRLLFLPLDLNLDYDYPVYKSFFEIPVITSFLTLTAFLYFAKRMFSKYRLISFSIFWFFLTLLPESSIVPQTDVIFEHRLYLPMAGFCIFLASGVFYLRSFASLRMTIVALSVIIACNSYLTFQRNKIWINEIVLWNDVVGKSPHKARPYINRGWGYYNQGNFTQALSDYNKAIKISPEFIYPYDDRGLIFAKEGKFMEAIAEYNKAIKINPYYAEVYYHRGYAYFMLKNYPEALSDYQKALKTDANYTKAQSDYTKSISHK
jgi:tetratricopeptide (TPR) repeat protein